ncbi:MAG: alpha/beta hydrolase [Anaerolineaceae bacterium]
MAKNQILPGAESYFLKGGKTGCILTHGFTCTPEEMRSLADYLVGKGFSAYGVRLSGHGTQPKDLANVTWQNWLEDIKKAYKEVKKKCDKVFLIGQSLGGMLSIMGAGVLPVDGVVALSTPYLNYTNKDLLSHIFLDWTRPMIHKVGVKEHPDWGIRREKDYPAYAAYPQQVFRQIYALSIALKDTLPYVKSPVLLIQSKNDDTIPSNSMTRFQKRLKNTDVETVLLEGFRHGITMDQKRDEAFKIIGEFLNAKTMQK